MIFSDGGFHMDATKLDQDDIMEANAALDIVIEQNKKN